MTKIRTSAYAVRCRVPTDHRHPAGTRTYNDNSGQVCSSIESLTGCQSRNGNLAVKHGEARPWSRTAADPTEILFDHLTPAGLSGPATTRKKEVKGKKSVQKKRNRKK